jgi:type II secretory ATPase GspE/PulE/Tfp pilus assembly ATPase PilB-like protein
MPELNTSEQPEALSFDFCSGDEAVDGRLNVDQMLLLIDGILPFEACLFYQVIPLSIEAGHLNLGMVNPDDTAAADYVRRQVSYINYSVVSWPVASDWHRQMLSKYLSYAAKGKPRSLSTPSAINTAIPNSSLTTTQALNADERATFIVDSPEEITVINRPTVDHPNSRLTSKPSRPYPTAASTSADVSPSASAAPLQLDLRAQTLTDLNHLAPKSLMETLLHEVLTQGIGRLYFERQAQAGRVLCSQDGVVQSVLEGLSLDLFQSVINELKRLTHLPLLPTTKTKQVEIERLYQQERVLLRLRLIASAHGEEATLQVLRGAALKFYQQQQIEQLGRDALGVAQTLQQRITAIRERARQTLSLEPSSTATLLAVSSLLKDMENQIDQLIQSSSEERSAKSSST